jgi:hypothetical protein
LIRAIAVTVAILLLLGGCIFGAAGQLSWPMAWAVLGVYSVSKAAAFAFVNPELIRERAAPGPGVDRGDVVLATLGYLGLYPGTLVAAGLDAVRFGPAIPIPQSIQATALLVFALGYGFAFWAVCSNPFFATFVRIQDDRDHSVVSLVRSHLAPFGLWCPRPWARSSSWREHHAKIERSGTVLSAIVSIRPGFVGVCCQGFGSGM